MKIKKLKLSALYLAGTKNLSIGLGFRLSQEESMTTDEVSLQWRQF